MILALLLLAASQTEQKQVTVCVTVPIECPACPSASSPVCPVDLPMYRQAVYDDVWALSVCMTGPHIRDPRVDDSPLWGFRPMDRDDPDYFRWRVCHRYDTNFDGDVDLADVQWSRMFLRGEEVNKND